MFKAISRDVSTKKNRLIHGAKKKHYLNGTIVRKEGEGTPVIKKWTKPIGIQDTYMTFTARPSTEVPLM